MAPIVKLLVLGGTGGTGRQVVAQALESGHDVTVLARDRTKAGLEHEHLRLVDGDVRNTQALGEAMAGQHAVVGAIGRGRSFKSENLIAESVPGILAAMQSHHIKRLLFTSAIGVGDTFRDASLPMKIFARTLLRGIYADKIIGDDLIRKSGLDWTIVQPVGLTDGPLTKRYRVGEHLPLSGLATISRADTAHFIVDRLADQSTFKKTLIVAN
jgi:putative NADH-flavin reductase